MKTVKKEAMSVLAAFSLIPALAMAAERVGDFALLDQEGYFHHMAWYDDHKAIANVQAEIASLQGKVARK